MLPLPKGGISSSNTDGLWALEGGEPADPVGCSSGEDKDPGGSAASPVGHCATAASTASRRGQRGGDLRPGRTRRFSPWHVSDGRANADDGQGLASKVLDMVDIMIMWRGQGRRATTTPVLPIGYAGRVVGDRFERGQSPAGSRGCTCHAAAGASACRCRPSAGAGLKRPRMGSMIPRLHVRYGVARAGGSPPASSLNAGEGPLRLSVTEWLGIRCQPARPRTCVLAGRRWP